MGKFNDFFQQMDDTNTHGIHGIPTVQSPVFGRWNRKGWAFRAELLHSCFQPAKFRLGASRKPKKRP